MQAHESDVIQLLAYAYLQNARPEKAVLLLDALDLVAPGERGVLRALAVAQMRSGQPQLALRTLERIATFDRVDATYHLVRAQALIACDRRIEAGAAMAQCIASRKTSAAGKFPS